MLYVVGNWYGAHMPFSGLFDEVVMHNRLEAIPNFSKKDTVLFGGGADIWAGLYKQKPNHYNGTNRLQERDQLELAVFEKAKQDGASFIGICRGAQLLCALSGGSLIQHVTYHGTGHDITTKDGEVIPVSSVHHQMMNPFSIPHEMIAWSSERKSSCYLVENNKDIKMESEPEVVYFPETRALGIQYHPEFMREASRGVSYAQEVVSKYILGE